MDEAPPVQQRTWALRGRASCIGAGLEAEALARASGWSIREAGELCLLVIELCTNADRHAGGGRCALGLGGADCEILVEDEGPGFAPPLLARFAAGLSLEELLHAPGTRAERGMGAGLDSARRLATRLTLENAPGGGARVRAWVARRRPGQTPP
jgi:anti-sigma regulatory factor (Ser/Thr protein kinase)